MQECSRGSISSHFPFPQLSLHTAWEGKDATGATHMGAYARQVPWNSGSPGCGHLLPSLGPCQAGGQCLPTEPREAGLGVGGSSGQPHMPGKVSRQHPPVGHRGLRRTSSPAAVSAHRADKSKDHHARASRAMPL